jgi:hypothetical protein
VWTTIHQPLAADPFNRGSSSHVVILAKGNAVVLTEVKLGGFLHNV